MRTLLKTLLLLFISIPVLAQTDNTVYVKNFAGATVGDMATAAQATCNPSLTCIVIFDPSLANFTQGTLPAPCATCVWEDYRVMGTFSITGNFYINGVLISGNGSGSTGGGGGNNGTLPAPTFSPAPGTYSGAQSVIIGLPPGATGCYTVDGSTPAAAGPGTCSHGVTYSSPFTVAASETINALATESGWTNSSVAGAAYTINSSGNPNYPTYSDNFLRADGSLGANWNEPGGAAAGLQIISNLVYPASAPVIHAFDIYTAGTFSNNQWSSFVVASNGSSSAAQGTIVRASTSSTNFYNDGVAVGQTAYRLGNQPGVDFCYAYLVGTYSIGDRHELDVAGSGPVFFWSKRNGTVDATCYDNTYNYTSGTPGLGMAGDSNSSPTIADGAWQGGSLPDFSNTPSDNFARANAGWLGVNWWFLPVSPQNSITSYFTLTSNAAALSMPSGTGIAIWTTPFNMNHSSAISIGTLQSSGWVGAVTRLTPGANGAATYYVALAEANGTIDLFAFNNGTWGLLSSSSYGSAINTLELDATGSSPVSLVIKVNGAQFGTYSDSTYKFTGTYAGFGISGTGASSTITGWQGSNL
jgi:Chitobiase/beta-hexosaminidase C-terminal domain